MSVSYLLFLPQLDDLIGAGDGGKTVGDDEARSSLRHVIEGFDDTLLGEGIDRGCRLVEDEERRIHQKDARDTKKLLLPLRQRDVLAGNGVIPVWKSLDKAMRAGCFCCRDDLFFRRIRAPVRDVGSRG